jgi:hypothetical protein
MASLTLKPVQAGKLSQALKGPAPTAAVLKGPAVTAPPAKVFHTDTSQICP